MSRSRQLERLVKIDAAIRSGQRHTADSLAALCEVSVRTLQSDLTFMRDRFDAPLEFRKSWGWRYADDQWSLPSLPLSQGEVFALTLGAQMLESYSGSIYHAPLQTAIERLADRLPESLQASLQSLVQERIRFRAGGHIQINSEIWTQLLDAITRSQSIWIRYFSPQSGHSERRVDPYTLDIYRASNPYLWGFCHRREKVLSFRIDRIQALQILEIPFQRDPNFNLEQILRDSFQYEVGGRPVDVVIDFDAKTAPYIAERQWHHTQFIKTHGDGSITLSFTATGLNDIKRWILGYGRGAIAREPPELVKMLRQEIETMARQNENGEFE
ncbi:MAG: WYL domain-containing protein [Cyanobacteria bacterium]|nr:WYL domain-containing protein [Cyanobacteriota bacterium]